MEKKLTPTHMYKTTVVFLDDDLNFINFLRENIKSKRHNLKFTNTLEEFNRIVRDGQKVKDGLSDILVKLDNELTDLRNHDVFDFDLSLFTKVMDNHNKSSEIGLVCVDNNLGETTGISICNDLAGDIRKILLTGQCNLTDAVAAFNNKTIDIFVDKLDPKLIAKLGSSIDKFVEQYFIDKNYYTNKLLSNRDFKEIFNKIIEDNNIEEYYLIEKDSILIIDNQGNKKLLTCWDDGDFDTYYTLHLDELNGNDSDHLSKIKNDKCIPVGDKLIASSEYKGLYYCITDA